MNIIKKDMYKVRIIINFEKERRRSKSFFMTSAEKKQLKNKSFELKQI